MKIDYSFHSHTFRCGHARGDIEDYVKKAIENNFKAYGVADHVFLPGVNQPTVRGDISYLKDYIDTFNKVKEKYKNKINLYLGFECEYADVFVSYYKELLDKVDYLICGQHCHFNDNKDYYWYFSYEKPDDYDAIERYKEDLTKAIRSGLFKYIAHPDLFFFPVTKITPYLEKVANEIIDEAIKYDVPLEVNYNGIRRRPWDKEHGTMGYPNEYFWQLAYKKGAKIIFGGDYHNVESIDNPELLKEFDIFINKTKIELMDCSKAETLIKSK